MTPTSRPDEHRDITLGPHAPGGAHVIVTIESIYELLVDVRDDVREVRTTGEATSRQARDHEHRIRSLEQKVWVAAGLAAAFGAGLSQLVPVLSG